MYLTHLKHPHYLPCATHFRQENKVNPQSQDEEGALGWFCVNFKLVHGFYSKQCFCTFNGRDDQHPISKNLEINIPF
jgi:hypothetical protein